MLVIRPIQPLFLSQGSSRRYSPLISAGGYIRTPNWVGNESGTPLEKRYLKIKVNRTESRYGKQFYYDVGSWVIKGLL